MQESKLQGTVWPHIAPGNSVNKIWPTQGVVQQLPSLPSWLCQAVSPSDLRYQELVHVHSLRDPAAVSVFKAAWPLSSPQNLCIRGSLTGKRIWLTGPRGLFQSWGWSLYAGSSHCCRWELWVCEEHRVGPWQPGSPDSIAASQWDAMTTFSTQPAISQRNSLPHDSIKAKSLEGFQNGSDTDVGNENLQGGGMKGAGKAVNLSP